MYFINELCGYSIQQNKMNKFIKCSHNTENIIFDIV